MTVGAETWPVERIRALAAGSCSPVTHEFDRPLDQLLYGVARVDNERAGSGLVGPRHSSYDPLPAPRTGAQPPGKFSGIRADDLNRVHRHRTVGRKRTQSLSGVGVGNELYDHRLISVERLSHDYFQPPGRLLLKTPSVAYTQAGGDRTQPGAATERLARRVTRHRNGLNAFSQRDRQRALASAGQPGDHNNVRLAHAIRGSAPDWPQRQRPPAC